jgi:glycerol-3-phosphate dehydrogenase
MVLAAVPVAVVGHVLKATNASKKWDAREIEIYKSIHPNSGKTDSEILSEVIKIKR